MSPFKKVQVYEARNSIEIVAGARLVHVVLGNGVIEGSIEVVEEVDYLQWRALRWKCREADDIRKVDRCHVVHPWLHFSTGFQFFRYESDKRSLRKYLRLKIKICALTVEACCEVVYRSFVFPQSVLLSAVPLCSPNCLRISPLFSACYPRCSLSCKVVLADH